MINVTKMKKMVKAERLFWGIEGEYMLASDGYRVYKDKIDSFNSSMKAVLFAEFGKVPEEGQTLECNKLSKTIKEASFTISNLLCKPEYFEKPVFYTGITMDGMDILRMEKGPSSFDSEYLQSVKNPEKATIYGNGEVISMIKLTFEGETMEYYLLPLRSENLEDKLREKLGFKEA